MTILEIILIAIGVSMDAFAVSICKGLSVRKIEYRYILNVGLWFGGFQCLMPIIGYYLGSTFSEYVTDIDHWIAFILLSIIGFNMIRESLSKDDNEHLPDFSVKNMSMMAVATSIDALAIGITFSFLNVEIISSSILIGVTTFIFSGIGFIFGIFFGNKFKSKAEFTGGCILFLIGVNILIEHTIGN